MSSVEAPIVRFHEQKLRVTLLGSGIFRARLPDGERMDLVRTVVKIETFVALKLEVGKLTGNVTSAWPTSIKYTESQQNSVNGKALKEVLCQISAQFLRNKFGEIAQQGIPLPRPLIPGVLRFENTDMVMEENYLRVDTDLRFRK